MMVKEQRKTTEPRWAPGPGSALLVVDVQNDFCPGGALPVPRGDAVVPPINAYARLFHERGLPVLASRDWHPPRHCSFKEQGGPWPPHCVQGSWGAQFHPALVLPPGATIVSKATDPARDAYSAFEGTSLESRLRELGCRRLYVAGLATDYCVKNSVLDARRHGFETVVLQDAIAGIEATPGDVERALRAMDEAGAVRAGAAEVGLEQG